MTEATTIARPYAKAIFELAKECGQYQKWQDLLAFLAFVIVDPQAREIIKGPLVSFNDKVDFITTMKTEIFDSQGIELVKLLLQYNRFLIVEEIYKLYDFYCSEEEHKIDVEVYSAIELSTEQKTKLETSISKYFKRKADLEWKQDPSLIGGLVIKSGDKVFDGSIKGKLKTLHEDLVYS